MRHRTVLIVLAMAGAAIAVAPAPAAAPPAPLFAAADRCLACHNGMTTPSGEDVSIGFAWRASIMANAARDPYWQAAVRRETVDHRDAAPRIEDECAACHMPMARFQARAAGRQGEIFTHLGDPLAIDGVSCSLCHQLQNGGPGLEHDGDFRIDTARAWGDRLVYGPYDIPQPRAQVMHSATGFRPARAANVETSELCSTCHTLYTTPVNADKASAPFPEQVPYLEWRASAYVGEKTCQACHMTFTAEAVPASSVLGEPRRRFARHGFQGANFFMLGMLARYASELGVAALPQELTASRQRTLELLEAEAASLSIAHAELRDGHLEVEVAVTNTAGHKLPTAYPSRRAWLRFAVTDAGGRRLFVSGELRPDGSIVGNDNDPDPLAFEPHHRVIDAPDQVQIYESILGDGGGRVTTGLLAAVRYLKDNRLLPRGFDKRTAPADCAVRGDAADDPDFQGGGDRVIYRASVPPGAAGPLRIEVDLLYQPIAFRWAHNLDRYAAAPEAARFVRYYDAMSSGSATALARASVTVNSIR
jgi:Cytochrome c554 and c-prime